MPRPNGDSPVGRAVTVFVSYHDKAGYFGDAKSLTPYIGIETARHTRITDTTEIENRPAGTGFTLVRASGGGTRTYEGRVQFNVTASVGVSSAKLNALLLAFKAGGAERWDSNTQSNYRIPVNGSVQPETNDMRPQGVLTP